MAKILFTIYKYIAVNSLMKGFLKKPNYYADFSYLAVLKKETGADYEQILRAFFYVFMGKIEIKFF